MSVIVRTPSIRESEVKLQEHFLRFISLHISTENISTERMTQLLQSYTASFENCTWQSYGSEVITSGKYNGM